MKQRFFKYNIKVSQSIEKKVINWTLRKLWSDAIKNTVRMKESFKKPFGNYSKDFKDIKKEK